MKLLDKLIGVIREDFHFVDWYRSSFIYKDTRIHSTNPEWWVVEFDSRLDICDDLPKYYVVLDEHYWIVESDGESDLYVTRLIKELKNEGY